MSEFSIKSVVQFNKGEALVLNRNPVFVYERSGDILFAKDGPFFNSYGYSKPTKHFQAFAGRKFSLPMKGGVSAECNGQWWSGGHREAADILGIREFVEVTKETVISLQKCYVFSGCFADKHGYEELREAHTGPVYGYWEYEKIIKTEKFSEA